MSNHGIIPSRDQRVDVTVVGGGHNGLVAACYLARAGRRVVVLEGSDHFGGATFSTRVFPDHDARLSQYSYLVSLLPDRIVADLGLRLRTLSRTVSSCSPLPDDPSRALVVARGPDQSGTRASMRAVTGSDAEFERWTSFYDDLSRLAARVAPTLTEPLLDEAGFRAVVGDDRLYEEFVTTPIGETVARRLSHDLTRGVALTDALIGTDAALGDLLANRCFLYHLIGNGTGEWKVPVGGMGALVDDLVRVATDAGVDLRLNSPVCALEVGPRAARVTTTTGDSFVAGHVLWAASPAGLATVAGLAAPGARDGCQVKVNMLLERLPRLRSGVPPASAFAGTFHVAETMTNLERAHASARTGALPDPLPFEAYCHTLTDPSVLGPEIRAAGWHALTVFTMCSPAALFDGDNRGLAATALDRVLSGFATVLEDDLLECLAHNRDGTPCIEVKTPLDLEEIGMRRGNIFHGDLQWPFASDAPPGQWGVETGIERVLLAGAGAQRGGGVSGIPGQNAAMAVLRGSSTARRH